jgi:NAD(P)H-hydrate epimerase
LEYDTQKPLLAQRLMGAHKGDFGHVLVIGGDEGMPGAPILAADAACFAGAGLVTVATRPQHVLAVTVRRPEALVYGVEDGIQLEPLLARASVIVLGPGLGQSAWSEALFQAALKTPLPLIVDADALNLLARQPRENQHWLLTPHPGEAARLLNVSVQEIQADRLYALKQLRHRYSGNVILKGANSLIINTQDQIFLCSRGHPAMASAGMGDVLTGVLAALVAQGLSLAEAAPLGVYAHAYAGEKAASDGKRSVLASDLGRYLQRII